VDNSAYSHAPQIPCDDVNDCAPATNDDISHYVTKCVRMFDNPDSVPGACVEQETYGAN
jgi:hypothetical protein